MDNLTFISLINKYQDCGGGQMSAITFLSRISMDITDVAKKNSSFLLILTSTHKMAKLPT